MPIKTKLISLFLAIALIPLAFVSALTFRNYRNSLESSSILKLQNIADFKVERIESFFSQKKSAVEFLSNSYALKKFLPVLVNRPDPSDPAFIEAKKTINSLLRKAQADFGVTDIMLVNPYGRIIYSSNPLHAGNYLMPLSSIKEEVFSEARKGVYASGIFLDKALAGRPAALIAAPVEDSGGVFSGLIVLEADIWPIYALLNDVTGLGSTGETLIGRKEGDAAVFLNPLKYNPEAAFRRKVKLGDKVAVGIQLAVQGGSGAGEFSDYRGKNVLGVWRYIPSLGLGVVAKIDTDEAFAEAINLRNLVFVILFIVFILSAIMAVIIAQLIAGPIKTLSKGVEEIGTGNLDYKVGIEQRDEIGQLSRAFDKMTYELKKAQDFLRKSSQYVRNLIEASLDPLLTISSNGRITDVNEAAVKVTGLSRQELIGTEFSAYFTEPEKARLGYREVFSKGFVTDYPLTIRHKDGRLTDVLYNASVYKDTQGNVLGVFAAARDITVLKRAEAELMRHRDHLEALVDERTAELSESEERLRHALDAGEFGTWSLNVKTEQAWHSLRHDQIFGYKTLLPEWTYRMFLEHVLPEDRTAVDEKFGQALAKRKEWNFECRIKRIDGDIRWIWAQGRPKLNRQSEVTMLIGLVQDITGRKRAEEELVRERTNLQKIFDVVSVGLLLIDEGGVVKRVNNTVASWMKDASSELDSKQPGDVLGCVHALSDPSGCGRTSSCPACPIRNAFERVLRTGEQVHNIETQAVLFLKGKQTNLWLEVSVDPMVLDGRQHAILSMNNITFRKESEEQLQRINRALQARSHIDRAVTVAENEGDFLKTACRIIIDDCGYPLVWIGYAENDEQKTVRPVASAGFSRGYLENLKVSWSDDEFGRGPTGVAIRSGKPSACTDMLNDPDFKPWRREADRYGYASSFVVPLLEKGRAFGAVCLYFKRTGKLGEEEAKLLVELVDDLSYGISLIRLRQAHLRTINALRESEDRYKRMVFTSPDAIIVQSAGRIRFANPAAAKIFREDEHNKLIGRPVLRVVSRDFRRAAKESIRSKQEQQVALEMKLIRFDGTAFEASLSGRGIVYAGKPAVQVIIRDITGIKKAQEILKRDKEALERLVGEKAQELMVARQKIEEGKRLSDIGTLAATVAHELRNPLAAMRMATYNIKRKAQNPEIEKNLENIEIKIKDSEQIINNLLFYSRLKMPRLENAGIFDILKDSIASLAAHFPKYNLTILQEFDGLKDVKVEADPLQLNELFNNILNNACEAVDRENGRIRILGEKEGGNVKLSFGDNGPGIKPEDAKNLFEPFFSTKAKGTGLGLAVCKQIVSLHNGSIRIENLPGGGAAVYITLPLKMKSDA
ncbi:MAG: PAS domain S-box protein [Candidatus Omnitrophica bacterium]|jgi:PAS domain S-box-containing protein|nr:PAS domain S-box protein [Candidatus Omnitrophota bacterium]